jgi:hypothetical protein
VLSRTGAAAVVVASAAFIGAVGNAPAMTTYQVPLTSAAELNIAHPSGGVGDPRGSGSVTLRINPAAKQLCYDFTVSGLSTPLMAHIHQGQALQIGPPVVTLFTGPGAQLDDCVMWTHSQLAEIVANPEDFYVSIETTEYPDGALRGQLG